MSVDGNAEQVRVIADQLADSIYHKLSHDLVSEERIEEKIVHAIAELETRINRKLLAAIFANAIPMIAAAFFMGMLWSKFSDVPQILRGRGSWMVTTEARINSLEYWASQSDHPAYQVPKTTTIPE